MSALQQVLMCQNFQVIYSTWNPSDKTSLMVLSGSNLVASIASGGGSLNQGVRGTKSQSSGKYYFEVTLTTFNVATSIGVADATWTETTSMGTSDAVSAGMGVSSGAAFHIKANSSGTNITAGTASTGQVIGVAVDVTNQLIYFAINNTWQNSAVPSSGTGGVSYVTTSAVFPAVFESATGAAPSVTLNVGASAFSFTPPTGFSAWG